jgi:hypothetical protein
VAITWTAPTLIHGSAVDSYIVQFKTASGTYVTDASCNPAAASAEFTARKCVVPMATIRTLTSLTVDSVIQVRVQAHNSAGLGPFSEINTAGATLETLPLQMSVPSFDVATSTSTQIKVTWNILTGTATGGSSVSITNYAVEWDQGLGGTTNFVSLTTVVSPTAFYLKTGLTAGTAYQFRVYGQNKYGNGPVSNAVTITAGQTPSVPAAPTTSVPTNSVYVKIQWTAPATNSFAIDAYEISIKKKDTTYNIDLTYCDGSSASVISTLSCLIPMTALRAAPYNLVLGDSVLAKV